MGLLEIRFTTMATVSHVSKKKHSSCFGSSVCQNRCRMQDRYIVGFCTGFVCVLKPLKTLDFQESDFKALKVLEIGFRSLKVLEFFIEQD